MDSQFFADPAMLVGNRQLFNDIVYTPLSLAVEELAVRWNDDVLRVVVDSNLSEPVPETFASGFKAVLFRSLASPNYELIRFMNIPDVLDLEPVILEIHNDKFTLNNSLKYFLAKLPIHQGFGKKGGSKLIFKKVLDFNASHKKKISEVDTLWGQALISFHHELISFVYPAGQVRTLDVSTWLHNGGRTAKDYYRDVMLLFVRHGILFENFVLEGEDMEFTRDVFLPAFMHAWQVTGTKPLIVALEPTDVEGDLYWMSYPQQVLSVIDEKMI